MCATFAYLVLYIGKEGYWEGRAGGKQGWFPQDAIQAVSQKGMFHVTYIKHNQITVLYVTLQLKQPCRFKHLPITPRARLLWKQEENKELQMRRCRLHWKMKNNEEIYLLANSLCLLINL